MLKNSNIYLLSLVPVLLIALLVIYFIGRSSGKGKSLKEASTPPQVNYPYSGQGIPAGWNPETLATALHDEMKGFTWQKIKLDSLLMQLLQLPTQDMFVGVYDVFNQKYFTAKNGTLRQWIQDEKYWGFPDIVRPKIYDRMNKLNLT